MAENIEFISAANLPTTEAKEVDVLCVEGGELKRKAGASLGGGSYDLDILITPVSDGDGWWTANHEIKTKRTCQEYFDMLAAGKIPVANIFADFSADTDSGMQYEIVPNPVWQTFPGQGVMCRGWSWDYCYNIAIAIDDTITVNIGD